MKRSLAVAGVLSLAGAAATPAAVLCQKKGSGVVVVRAACRKKESPIDLTQFGVGGTSSPDTPDQVRAKFFAGSACPGNDPADIMVKVGNICVDTYEASVWSGPTGGTQYGVSRDDYPCSLNGNDCTNIYARSVAGVMPSRFISWFQAAQACRNAGKRLLTNAEWQMAAAGSTGCAFFPEAAGPKATGSFADCVSTSGVRDMVGNVSEWVADWVPWSFGCTTWGHGISNDQMCMAFPTSDADGPGALYRGGYWVGGGVFTLFDFLPSQVTADSGFRCGR